MSDCVNCATGWAEGPLCREHANERIGELEAALRQVDYWLSKFDDVPIVDSQVTIAQALRR